MAALNLHKLDRFQHAIAYTSQITARTFLCNIFSLNFGSVLLVVFHFQVNAANTIVPFSTIAAALHSAVSQLPPLMTHL